MGQPTEQEVADPSAVKKKQALDSEASEGAETRQTEAAPQMVPQTPQDSQWWEGGQKIQSKQ